MLLVSIGRSHLFGGCNQAELLDPEIERKEGLAKSAGSRSLEGLSTYGRLGLEGLLLFMYSNLFSSGLIYSLEGGEEVFRRLRWFPL